MFSCRIKTWHFLNCMVCLFSFAISWKSRLHCPPNLTRTSFCDKYSGSMNMTTHLDHIRHLKEHLVQIGRIDGPLERLSWILTGIKPPISASERRWNTLKHFQDLHLRARATIWLLLSDMSPGSEAASTNKQLYTAYINFHKNPGEWGVGPFPFSRPPRLVLKAHRLVYHSTLG